MAVVAENIVSREPEILDPVATWTSLVAFSRKESKRLEKKPGTRNAAVTIVLRFSCKGQTIDTSSLVSGETLIADETAVGKGMSHFFVSTTQAAFPALNYL